MKKRLFAAMMVGMVLVTACSGCATSNASSVEQSAPSSQKTVVENSSSDAEDVLDRMSTSTEEISFTSVESEEEHSKSKWSDMNWEEIYSSFDEKSPVLGEVEVDNHGNLCKCIETVEFTGKHNVTWDIWLYVDDGDVHTLIVSNDGHSIDLYGVYDGYRENDFISVRHVRFAIETIVRPSDYNFDISNYYGT